jgi:hypothetical protein
MAEAESITVDVTDDEILLRASELLAEHRPCRPMWRGKFYGLSAPENGGFAACPTR